MYHIIYHHIHNNSSKDIESREKGFAADIMHDDNIAKFLSSDGKSIAEITTSKDVTLVDVIGRNKTKILPTRTKYQRAFLQGYYTTINRSYSSKTFRYAQPKDNSLSKDELLANIHAPEEKEPEDFKANTEIVKCSIPGKSDYLFDQMVAKIRASI